MKYKIRLKLSQLGFSWQLGLQLGLNCSLASAGSWGLTELGNGGEWRLTDVFSSPLQRLTEAFSASFSLTFSAEPVNLELKGVNNQN